MPEHEPPKKIRILRVLPTLDFGGVESRVALQARLYDSAQHEMQVCTFHRAGAAADAIRRAGVPVHVLGVDPSPRNFKGTWHLAHLIRRVRPHVVHASIAEANLHALAGRYLYSAPVVISEETGMPSHGRVAKLTFRLLYRYRADAMVGITQAVCNYMLEVDRAPREKVKLIYNCANPRFFPEQRRSPPTLGKGEGAPFRVLVVGRLVPVKNHLRFLEAFVQFAQHHPNCELQIAGDGPLRTEVAAAVARVPKGINVQLLGFRDDVMSLLANADVYALPSHAEGCSVSLIEAMAMGVLPLVSTAPGNLEVVGSAGSQWAAPSRDVDAWVALLDRAYRCGRSQLSQLGVSSQARAYRHFSPEAYIRNVQQLYRSHLDRARTAMKWAPR